MSRHRGVRNMDADEFEDDDSYGSSASSYVEETSLSRSMENYIYKRGGGGHTPKMGHFVLGRTPSVPEEEEEEGDETGLRRMRPRSDSETSSGSNSNPFEDLQKEDQVRLADCLEEILDIVGESMPENLVKEAIVRCDFNKEVALNTLLNNPIGHSGKQRRQKRKRSPKTNEEKMDIEQSGTSQTQRQMETSSNSKPASPPKSTSKMDYKDIPTIRTEKEQERNKKTLLKPVLPNQADSQRSRSQSPAVSSPNESGRATPVGAAAASIRSTPSSNSLVKMSQMSMRKAKIDPMEEYKKEREQEKDLLNLVVVGHVDSGKSTLMGHLLYTLGSVNSKTMHKYEQDSKKLGKQSFAYAWVLDETAEERERGITMDVGQSRFETPTKSVTLLDAPGHKDFIPNMISGAYQADVAILVVNSTRGEFEAGFEAGGQTREHALLVRSLGVTQIVVAVNKLDTVDWSKDRFDDICARLRGFLKTVGFRDSDVTYVPCSGFTGDNLREKSDNLGWHVDGPTLLEAIDAFRPPERLIQKPFRMSVSDIFKAQSSGFACAGRIESGYVQKDDKVLIMPLTEVATVKSVMASESSSQQCAFAGDHVSLGLVGPDQNNLSMGMVICDPSKPIPVSKHIKARIVVFNVEVPITKGYPVVFHYGSVQTQAVIKKLLATMSKSTGEVAKKKPRCIAKNCNAIVEISIDSPICVEQYSNIKELGRFMLRAGGKTIAAGIVTDIY